VPVTLADLYNGKQVNFQNQKTVLCPTCEGKGSSNPNATTKCNSCRGQGYNVVLRQIGLGLVTQSQEICRQCNGEGEMIRPKDRCKTCNGQKIKQEAKQYQVFVEKGMKHEQKITLYGEGDQAPDTTPGDVVLVLQQSEHPVFKRDGDDLIMHKKISLYEALCGFQFPVTHLDGRTLLVKSNSVVKPGDKKSVPNEGMPHFRNPTERGQLVIVFDVEFPDAVSIPPKVAEVLAQVLPKPAAVGSLPADTEEVFVEDLVGGTGRPGQRRPTEAYHEDDGEMDDDEDGHPHRQGVSCVHQ
jgi:DnaJ family protein A protein 2